MTPKKGGGGGAGRLELYLNPKRYDVSNIDSITSGSYCSRKEFGLVDQFRETGKSQA